VNIISDKPKAGVAERRDRRVVMLCLLMGFSNVVSSVQTPWLASAAVKFGAADGQTLEPVEGHVQGQLLRAGLNHEVVMPSRKVHHFTLKTQAFRAARASFAPTDAVAHVRVFPGPMWAVFSTVRGSPAGDSVGACLVAASPAGDRDG
jgi:hypothetical protein